MEKLYQETSLEVQKYVSQIKENSTVLRLEVGWVDIKIEQEEGDVGSVLSRFKVK